MNFHHLSTQSHLRTAQIQLKQFHPPNWSEEIHANQDNAKIRAKWHDMGGLLDYLNLHLRRDFQPKIELGPCLLINPKDYENSWRSGHAHLKFCHPKFSAISREFLMTEVCGMTYPCNKTNITSEHATLQSAHMTSVSILSPKNIDGF